MNEDVTVTIARVRERVMEKTLIQDISDPLSGAIDRRRLAAKFVNLESSVGDLANAVKTLDTKVNSLAS